MKKRMRTFWMQAGPTEYLLHYRRGKLIRQGMGIGAIRLPADHITIVPCTAQSLTFAADQITRENQGIEIAGFAVWKVAEPALTAQRFNFDDPDEPTKAIGASLKDVVESAIRHRVANMTIEEVLRRRASIIVELKKELDYITAQWGLSFDTIEIKQVRIMSREVFAHLQAAYREAIRLESETSRLQTEQAIMARQLKLQEERQEQENALASRAQEQKHKLLLQNAALEYERETLADRKRQELAREKMEQEKITLEAETRILAAREQVDAIRRGHALAARQHELESASLEAGAMRQKAEANNLRRADLALIEALPAALAKLNVKELNLTPDLLTNLIRQLRGRSQAA